MTQKRKTLSENEVIEHFRKAFAHERAVVRLEDHRENVEIEFLSEDGIARLTMEPIPLERLSTVAELNVIIVQIKRQLE